MRRYTLHYILACVLLLLVVQPLIASSAQTNAGIEIIGANFAEYPYYTVYLRIKDTNGTYKIDELQSQDVMIYEDNTLVLMKEKDDIHIEHVVADKSNPEQEITLQSGDKEHPYTLYTTGATIGVVFDATTKLNTGGVDLVQIGREKIISFLNHTGVQATRDPEAISLFIPTDNPEQQVQPAEFVDFTQDRNAVINYLNAITPRTNATMLYVAIQAAVQKTAFKAQERGSNALVLVVSDGADNTSNNIFNEIVRFANEQNVAIVTFGLKPNTSGANQLSQLAQLTNGIFRVTPDDMTISTIYTDTIHASPSALYTLQYKTPQVEDGKMHMLKLKIKLPDGQMVESEDIPFGAGGNQTAQELENSSYVLKRYLVVAIPIAMLTPVILIIITRLSRSGLVREKTQKTR